MANEYGFTGSDIASISQARAGLTAGFMQLGRQIQDDIQRIATTREMRAFGQEMAQLDPTQDAFPQQLLGTLSRYPLASQTPIAKQGIEVLGSRYQAALQAKQTASALQPFQIGNTTYDPRLKATYRLDEQGNPTFIDPTPQSTGALRGMVIQTPENQLLINPATGETMQTFAPRPSSMRSTNLNVLPENVKMQIRFIDEDARAVQTERQKLVDAITNGTIMEKDRPAAVERQKQLETQLQNIKDTRDKILQEAAAQQSERLGLPSGAGQGMGGPSLMPAPQGGSSFVPMPVPVPVNPNQIPNPANMTMNEPGGAVMPDQLPVLPNVRPSIKQLSGPRLYRKVGGRMEYRGTGKDFVRAVQQAYDDQQITEEEARRAVEEAGFRRNP